MRKPDGQTVFLALAVTIVTVVFGYLLVVQGNGRAGNPTAGRRELKLDDIPFNGARAYETLRKICQIGPRVSGTPGMLSQQAMLRDHFTKLGGQVRMQEFDVRHPQDGSRVPMANMIVKTMTHPRDKRSMNGR